MSFQDFEQEKPSVDQLSEVTDLCETVLTMSGQLIAQARLSDSSSFTNPRHISRGDALGLSFEDFERIRLANDIPGSSRGMHLAYPASPLFCVDRIQADTIIERPNLVVVDFAREKQPTMRPKHVITPNSYWLAFPNSQAPALAEHIESLNSLEPADPDQPRIEPTPSEVAHMNTSEAALSSMKLVLNRAVTELAELKLDFWQQPN